MSRERGDGQLSRRALLAAASAVPAAAAVGTGGRPAAAAPAAGRAADHARLLANAVALLAGTPAINARPEVADRLAAVEATALRRLAAMDRAGDGELFEGLPLGDSDANLNASFRYLYEIALACRVPGDTPSELRGDPAVQRRVVDGLAWLHEHHYGDQAAGYYGNWFTWEIGISTHVSRTLVLLAETVAAHRPELNATYVASMDAYLRNGQDGDVDLDSRFHTGANLADITTNRILQGALLGGEAGAARVAKAVADQLTVLATIDPYHLRHGVTDGFYADGSFVQHGSVAYTGSYGVGLLTRAVQTLALLAGTGHAPGGDVVATVRRWVVDGFAPLVFEGWMMEIVRGRAVARDGSSGYDAVTAVVEAVVGLTEHLTGADATALESYVRYLARTSPVPPAPAAFVSPVSVARYADILADASAPARDLNPAARHVAFNAMDRTVHRRPGYAFALARSSRRISKYEYMNGENLRPWFQGDGAHHLYLAGQDQRSAFGVDYYTVVSPHRLAGVTAPVEDRATVPELYGERWYDNPEAGFTASSEAQNAYVYFPRGTNAYSGGATLEAYGAAGLVVSDDAAWAAARAGALPEDFVAYRTADATRSWFFFDEEIVVLAAGVGDGAGRPVTASLDTRVADPSDEVTVTGELADGSPFAGAGTAPLAWLRYANASRPGEAVGYVFLDGPRPTVTLETVTRSRRLVRLDNADTPVTRRVFTVGVEVPAGAPPATTAWLLVPHATAAVLRGHADGPVTVLANDVRRQAVRHAGLGIVAVNTFAPGRHPAGPLTVHGPASVLLRRRDDGATTLAVADPTTEQETVTVVVRGRPLRPVEVDEGVRVSRVPGGTRLDVTTRHAHGRSLTARLAEQR